MRTKYFRTAGVLASIALALAGCSGKQPQVMIQEEKTLAMEASSFEFRPNNIRAAQGDTVALDITNISDTGHNFTVENPQGRVIQSVDLPPGETVHVEIALEQPGGYDFYCNKPFHPTFGMKGRILAAASSSP